MSFLYPRIVSFTRPGAQNSTTVGDQGEAPDSQRSLETPVASNIQANIQARRTGGKGATGLPGGGPNDTWRIFVPKSALAAGVVVNNDIATDDLGRRFKVSADYVNSLGANFICERLEA